MYLYILGAKLNKPDKEKAFALHYAVQLCGSSSGGGDDRRKSKDKGKKKDKKKGSTGDASATPTNGLDVSIDGRRRVWSDHRLDFMRGCI